MITITEAAPDLVGELTSVYEADLSLLLDEEAISDPHDPTMTFLENHAKFKHVSHDYFDVMLHIKDEFYENVRTDMSEAGVDPEVIKALDEAHSLGAKRINFYLW